MTRILHVISSPRGSASMSVQLGNAIVARLLTQYPDAVVTERNVAAHPFPHLEEVYLGAFFAPPAGHTPAQATAVRHSDEVIAEVQAADILVIGAPMYNLTIPAGLKEYFDHLARAGVTFRYTPDGLIGLVQGKKAYLAVAAGGIYSEGAQQGLDFVVPYIRTFLGLMGITDITPFWLEGTAIPGVQETALQRSLAQVRETIAA